MENRLIEHAAACFGTSPSKLTPLQGGNFSTVFEFLHEDRRYVLRLIPPHEEYTVEAVAAIQAWVSYLAAHGAPVADPLLSENKRLVEVYDDDAGRHLIVATTKAPGILAETLELSQWNETLFERLGQAAGKLHALAAHYEPSRPEYRRPHWDEVPNCHNPEETLDETHGHVARQYAAVRGRIATLPKGREHYGMIHADFHAANFFVDAVTQTITVFDFDDCVYGWYMMDVALVLLDMLVVYPYADKAQFAKRFLTHFLRGYLEEKPLEPVWITQLPEFLTLAEIGLYTMVYRYHDPEDAGSWIGKFMSGNRRARIENGLPYIDLDFAGILRDAQQP
ncbi:MAG: phosphotransferase [Anaerolineae bacterium]|nr:phosphotransferase [Anaerolineae bacterium]